MCRLSLSHNFCPLPGTNNAAPIRKGQSISANQLQGQSISVNQLLNKHTRVKFHILSFLTEYVAFVRYTPILEWVVLLFSQGVKHIIYNVHACTSTFATKFDRLLLVVLAAIFLCLRLFLIVFRI